MKKHFRGYYRPSEQDYEKLWTKGIVAVDANVLLDVYRYSEATVADLLANFGHLGKRLWTPYQAAAEYHRNLESVIASQIAPYNEAKLQAQSLLDMLSRSSRHPFIDESVLTELGGVIERVTAALDTGRVKLEGLITDNPIKEQLAELLGDKVGDPLPDDELKNLLAEGPARYERRIPPGYQDKDKPEPDRYGDLILWRQLINEASARKAPLLFVSADVKEDWFLRIAGKTVGPRPELCEEFQRSTGQLFYAYPTDTFLRLATKYLKATVRDSTIEEVKHREESDLLRRAQSGEPRALMHLVDAHFNAILRGVRSELSSEADVQEALHSFVDAAPALLRRAPPNVNLERWFYFQAARHATRYMRNKAREEQARLPLEIASSPRERLAAALERLPDRQKKLLTLTEIEGFSPAEAASLMGMTPGRIEVELRRARRSLVDVLGSSPDDSSV